MARLTFVDGDITTGGAYAMNANAAFNGGTVGNIGMWCLEAGAGMTVTAPDHLDSTAGEFFLDNGGGQALYDISPTKFQITQQTTAGYPYASGIIERERVKRVSHTAYLASAVATTTAITIVQQAPPATGAFKIVKLAGPESNYNEFLNPTGEYDDRAGQIRNYSFAFQADLALTCTEIARVVNADAGRFVQATASATQITLAGRDNGTSFQVIDTSLLIDPTNGVAGTTWSTAGASFGTFGFTEGVGNGWQAVAAERTSLHHKTAHHNRIWFADTIEQFASTAGTYDIFTITCDHGIGGQTGANWKDNLVVELWIDSNYTDGGGLLDDFWGPATSTQTAGSTQVLYTQS